MSDSVVANIHTDGAARGNPGPGAFAYVIARDGDAVIEENGVLGRTTNNVAEYTALVKALEHAVRLGLRRVVLHSDSELMVKQLNGEYQVKNADLRELYRQAQKLMDQFGSVDIRHVRREQNRQADRLCNEALDGETPKSAPDKRGKPREHAPANDEQENVKAEAVECLTAAAKTWSLGDPNMPPPDQVWEQLWSILAEAGVLRPKRAR